MFRCHCSCLVCSFVKVNVRMDEHPVAMTMRVKVGAAIECSSKGDDTQNNNHQRQTEFQPTSHALRDSNSQRQHNRANDHQGRCVTSSPKAADDRCTGQLFVFAYDCRNCHDVISFGSVLKPVDKPEPKQAH